MKKLTNWGLYPVSDSLEYSFQSTADLQRIVHQGEGMIARGKGRCYGDASLSAKVISTLKYNCFLNFDHLSGEIECQSGVSLEEVLEVIVPKGWFLPVTPGTKYVTVGGAVASDVHGKNHHVDGSFSNHILDMTILTGKGEVKKCSPTENAELFRTTCGGMGLTGIILTVRFRLKKIRTSFIDQIKIKASNLDDILDLFEKHKDATYSMAWIDCLKGGEQFGRSILYLGEHAGEDQLNDTQKKKKLAIPTKRPLFMPIYLPSFTLNKWTIRLFNSLIYHSNRKHENRQIVPYEGFFYPLDSIKHWNRMYGRRGFVQYQFVVPLQGGREALKEILTRINQNGQASFLAVLKAFGKQDSFISFPMEGYTLALDFSVSKKLFRFLDELDELVVKYGGRIYLTKDARMQASVFDSSYANSGLFKQIIRRYSVKKFRSMQSQRLNLTNE